MVLLRILLILTLFYYLFRLLFRVVLPWFLARRLRKMQEQHGSRFDNFRRQQQKQEGEVTIHTAPKKGRSGFGPSADEGEYVDYEEIK